MVSLSPNVNRLKKVEPGPCKNQVSIPIPTQHRTKPNRVFPRVVHLLRHAAQCSVLTYSSDNVQVNFLTRFSLVDFNRSDFILNMFINDVNNFFISIILIETGESH